MSFWKDEMFNPYKLYIGIEMKLDCCDMYLDFV